MSIIDERMKERDYLKNVIECDGTITKLSIHLHHIDFGMWHIKITVQCAVIVVSMLNYVAGAVVAADDAIFDDSMIQNIIFVLVCFHSKKCSRVFICFNFYVVSLCTFSQISHPHTSILSTRYFVP